MFAESGFFQTKVDDIAKLSRMSPATVYAQCGGKQGLLRSLMDSWTQSPLIAEAIQECFANDDAVLVMQSLAGAYLLITKKWGEVIKVVLDIAPRGNDTPHHRAATGQTGFHRNLPTPRRCWWDTRRCRRTGGFPDHYLLLRYRWPSRTREIFDWSLERSNEWRLAHASAAILRSPLESAQSSVASDYPLGRT